MSDHTLRHLKEALEQLASIIDRAEFPPDPEDAFAEEDDLPVELAHLYHHLNTAVNGIELESPWEEDEARFVQLNEFPTQLPQVFGPWTRGDR